MDLVPIHRGTLNLAPIAIIGQQQIAEQVADHYNIDQTIYRNQKLLKLAEDPAKYLQERTTELNALKEKINKIVKDTVEGAQKNGVPAETRNEMAYELALAKAKIGTILVDYKYPMSDTAQKVTASGRADAAKVETAAGNVDRLLRATP